MALRIHRGAEALRLASEHSLRVTRRSEGLLAHPRAHWRRDRALAEPAALSRGPLVSERCLHVFFRNWRKWVRNDWSMGQGVATSARAVHRQSAIRHGFYVGAPEARRGDLPRIRICPLPCDCGAVFPFSISLRSNISGWPVHVLAT